MKQSVLSSQAPRLGQAGVYKAGSVQHHLDLIKAVYYSQYQIGTEYSFMGL